MPQSYNRIWIHSVWATKNRFPFISQFIEKEIFAFISEQFRNQGCPVRIINGMPDHVHCLYLLNPTKSISEIIKQVKGSSSSFINSNNLIQDAFDWQDGYASFSVSDSIMPKVYQYIKNQKKHHLIKSFEDEQKEMMKLLIDED
jgi:putative transposase